MDEIVSWDEICDFAFLALQLLDKATLFSKNEVLKEYEKNKNADNIEDLLFKKSNYPNGQRLRFYNCSKYTLNDLLNKKEIVDEKWYIIKKEFEAEYMGKNEFFYDVDMEREFEKYLREKSPMAYWDYEKFEKNFRKEFSEYFSGFSAAVQHSFLKIIPELYDELFYKVKNNINKGNPIDLIEGIENTVSNRLLLNWFCIAQVEDMFNLEEDYVSYEEMRDFFLDVLFEDIDFFYEKASILCILPENPFIFHCFDYILWKNPDIVVDFYLITRSRYMYFLLNFLGLISNTRYFVPFRYDSDEGSNNEKLHDFFEEFNQFDFIFQSNYSESDLIDDESTLSHYGVQVSTRVMSISEFGYTSIFDDWLKKDLLESLILIPYKNTIRLSSFEEEDIFKLALVTTLNFDKSKKQKNKFLVVDKNHNYDVTSRKHSFEDYKNIVKSNEIFDSSYLLFSEFVDSDNSKIFYIDNYMNKINNNKNSGIVDFNFNDEMYDVKMKSQKTYLEIDHVENENRITKKLDYPIEKLGNLIEEVIGYGLDNEGNMYLRKDVRYADKIVFSNSEIGDKSHYHCYKLISENVSLKYLYYYLNSELGKKEFYYHLRGHSRLNDDVYNIRVPIPPKEDQDRILEAMNRIDELLSGMEQLKTRVNINFFNHKVNLDAIEGFFGKREYNEETQELSISNNWQYAYSGLIWPLAITYLIATSGGYEKTGRAKNLLRLFEFTAAFNTIVLISGIPEDIYQERKHTIWSYAYDKKKQDKKFVDELRLSFGSWVTFHYKLKSKIYERKKFKTEINKEFYMNLLKGEILEDYNKLKEYRNKDAHGSLEDEDDAMELIDYLSAPKDKVFDYLNECYKNLRLYYTTKTINVESDGDEEIFIHDVIFLNGPYSMPIYDIVKSKKRLKTESLYLHDILENKFTKLNDKLIKFRSLDKHDWRLYIFIGFVTDKETGQKKARYKCYQRKEKNDYFEDIDLDELM